MFVKQFLWQRYNNFFIYASYTQEKCVFFLRKRRARLRIPIIFTTFAADFVCSYENTYCYRPFIGSHGAAQCRGDLPQGPLFPIATYHGERADEREQDPLRHLAGSRDAAQQPPPAGGEEFIEKQINKILL